MNKKVYSGLLCLIFLSSIGNIMAFGSSLENEVLDLDYVFRGKEESFKPLLFSEKEWFNTFINDSINEEYELSEDESLQYILLELSEWNFEGNYYLMYNVSTNNTDNPNIKSPDVTEFDFQSSESGFIEPNYASVMDFSKYFVPKSFDLRKAYAEDNSTYNGTLLMIGFEIMMTVNFSYVESEYGAIFGDDFESFTDINDGLQLVQYVKNNTEFNVQKNQLSIKTTFSFETPEDLMVDGIHSEIAAMFEIKLNFLKNGILDNQRFNFESKFIQTNTTSNEEIVKMMMNAGKEIKLLYPTFNTTLVWIIISVVTVSVIGVLLRVFYNRTCTGNDAKGSFMCPGIKSKK